MRDFFLRLVAAAALGAALACGIHVWRMMHPPPPAPPEVVRRLAPPGEYYLVQYVSAQTAGGVIGFPPGTRVTLRADNGELWRVSDGRYDADVRPAQLTNDLDVADWARSSDEAAQTALAEFQQRERDEWQRTHLAEARRQAAAVNAADAASRGSVGNRDTQLNDAARPVADGRSVAGSAWVYPALTVVERRTAGAAADLRLRVPSPPSAKVTSSVPLGTSAPVPARTPAPAASPTPRSTPTPPPARP